MHRASSDNIVLQFQLKLRQALKRYAEVKSLGNVEALNALNQELFAPLRKEAKEHGLDYAAQVAAAQAATPVSQGK